MLDVLPTTLPPRTETTAKARAPILMESVYVVGTTGIETRAAIEVAHELSRRLGVPLTVVDFQTTRSPRRAAGRHWLPQGADEIAAWLRQRGFDANVRLYICRKPQDVFAMVFRPRSLVVLSGARHWWPTRARRLRAALERAGHYVLLVDRGSDA